MEGRVSECEMTSALGRKQTMSHIMRNHTFEEPG